MTTPHRIRDAALFGVMLAAAITLALTYQKPNTESSATPRITLHSLTYVDERPLRIARSVSGLASTLEERLLAERAIQVADEALDMAYAEALRLVAEQPPVQSPEVREISKTLSTATTLVKADQENIDKITKQITRTSGPRKDSLNQLLDLQQARLELDQQRLDDLKSDLIRAGGDPGGMLKIAFESHKLGQQHGANGSTAESSPAPWEEKPVPANLVAQFGVLYSLSGKTWPLQQAQEDAQAQAAALSQRHNALEMQIEAHVRALAGTSSSESKKPVPVAEEIASLRRQASDQKTLTEIGKRIENQKELAVVYGEWLNHVTTQKYQGMRGVTRSLVWILFIVLAGYFIDRLLQRLLSKVRKQHTEFGDVTVIAHFAAQAAGVLLVLAVMFGIPDQFPSAVFGVIGAGVTVASKDIFLGFIDNHVRHLISAAPSQG